MQFDVSMANVSAASTYVQKKANSVPSDAVAYSTFNDDPATDFE